MPVSLNTNLLALNTARNLQGSYGRLAASVERLSSGLRVNSADDDAAGLAIRELMRADIAALRQGVRNANDAISMIQVADGALGIIDEKLIRMKELAEQAATGTYDSTQRLMIDSEFKAMADEIDRIARATDFNGIKLLDGSREGEHDGSALDATGKLKIHFGSGNDSAEDYYYVEIADCTLSGLGLREHAPLDFGMVQAQQGLTNIASYGRSSTNESFENPSLNDYGGSGGGATPIFMTNDSLASIQDIVPTQGAWYGTSSPLGNPDFSYAQNFMFLIPKGAKNVTINMIGVEGLVPGDNDIQLFTKSGVHLAGTPLDDYAFGTIIGIDNSIDAHSDLLGFSSASYDGTNLNSGGGKYDPTGRNLNYTLYNGMNICYSGDADRYDTSPNDGRLNTWEDYETLTIDEATEDLIVWLPGGAACGFKAYWDPASVPAPNLVNPYNPDLPGGIKPTGDVISIDTQDKAQAALERIDKSITIKDKVRAHLGALQNRLENTVTNLTIQAENLQAAESRISDADVGLEMMLFVRNQILTQAGVAMLSQANSLPQMMVGLLSR